MRTFMDDLRAGHITPEQIDDYIDRWHNDPNPFGPKLHEFLGLTWDEYKTWVEGDLPYEMRLHSSENRDCRNEREPDGLLCTGQLHFEPGDVQAKCTVCGGWEGRWAPPHQTKKRDL